MKEEQIQGHKELASAVLQMAIADLKVDSQRDNAIRFLTSEYQKKDRAVWLAWLGLSDDAFQALLIKKVFQGQKNRTLFAEAA